MNNFAVSMRLIVTNFFMLSVLQKRSRSKNLTSYMVAAPLNTKGEYLQEAYEYREYSNKKNDGDRLRSPHHFSHGRLAGSIL